MPKKLTTEEFITKAKAVHGNKYDYSKTIYINSSNKVNIHCYIHGAFDQDSRVHLIGGGCPKCGKIKCSITRTIWDYEKIKKIVDTINTRTEFKEKHGGAYSYAKKNGFLNEINDYIDLKSTKKPCLEWTEELVRKRALECKTKQEFREKYRTGRTFAKRIGIYDEITSHMISPNATPEMQNIKGLNEKKRIEFAMLIAKKYKHRWDFRKENPGCVKVLIKNNLYEEACSHMEKKGNRFKRALYEFRFPQINATYIGLTYNYKTRLKQHLNNSSNKKLKLLIKNGEPYEWIEYNEWYSIQEIGEKESELITLRRNEGFEILNKAKAGNVGGPTLKYKKIDIYRLVVSCKSYSDFYRHTKEVHFAQRNNMIERIKKYYKVKPKTQWSYELIIKKAKEFKEKGYNRSEFIKLYSRAYAFAKQHNFIKEIFDIIPLKHKLWSETEVREIASKCKYKTELKKFGGLISYAVSHGIYEEITSHMQRKPIGKLPLLQKEQIEKLAKNCESRGMFKSKHSKAYNDAKKYGILNEVCSHMKYSAPTKWNREKVEELSQNFINKFQLRKKYPGAYVYAVKGCFINELKFKPKAKPVKNNPQNNENINNLFPISRRK